MVGVNGVIQWFDIIVVIDVVDYIYYVEVYWCGIDILVLDVISLVDRYVGIGI